MENYPIQVIYNYNFLIKKMENIQDTSNPEIVNSTEKTPKTSSPNKTKFFIISGGVLIIVIAILAVTVVLLQQNNKPQTTNQDSEKAVEEDSSKEEIVAITEDALTEGLSETELNDKVENCEKVFKNQDFTNFELTYNSCRWEIRESESFQPETFYQIELINNDGFSFFIAFDILQNNNYNCGIFKSQTKIKDGLYLLSMGDDVYDEGYQRRFVKDLDLVDGEICSGDELYLTDFIQKSDKAYQTPFFTAEQREKLNNKDVLKMKIIPFYFKQGNLPTQILLDELYDILLNLKY